jgi:hypothetical protein
MGKENLSGENGQELIIEDYYTSMVDRLRVLSKRKPMRARTRAALEEEVETLASQVRDVASREGQSLVLLNPFDRTLRESRPLAVKAFKALVGGDSSNGPMVRDLIGYPRTVFARPSPSKP